MFKNKFFAPFVLLAFILFAASTVFFYQQSLKHQVPLPILGEVANFELTDTNRQPFGSKNLNGKIWIADFVFTTCGSICPIMTNYLSALQRTYDLVEGVEFVSVSVNPENDSPEVLKSFAQKYKANLNKWHFLTGSRQDITDLAVKSFKLGSVDEPIFHSDKFALVDRRQKIRGYYQGTNKIEINKLFMDISQLLKEK